VDVGSAEMIEAITGRELSGTLDLPHEIEMKILFKFWEKNRPV